MLLIRVLSVPKLNFEFKKNKILLFALFIFETEVDFVWEKEIVVLK